MPAPKQRISQFSESNLAERHALLHPERYQWKTLSPAAWPFCAREMKNLRLTCTRCQRVVTAPLVIHDTLLCEACGCYRFTIQELVPPGEPGGTTKPKEKKKKSSTKRFFAIGLRLLATLCCIACIIGAFGKVIQSHDARTHASQEAATNTPKIVLAGNHELFNELAGSGNKEAAIKALLQRGADPTARDRSGSTPLILAVQKGDHALCELLLKYGADAEAQDRKNKTALDYAKERYHSAIITLLRQHGATR